MLIDLNILSADTAFGRFTSFPSGKLLEEHSSNILLAFWTLRRSSFSLNPPVILADLNIPCAFWTFCISSFGIAARTREQKNISQVLTTDLKFSKP